MSAWVSAVFTLVVAATLLLRNWSIRYEQPLASPQLKQARERLKLNPSDEKLKWEVRQLDLKLREEYFGELATKKSGVYLLIGASIVFVLSVGQLQKLRSQPPMPGPLPESSERPVILSRWFVAGTGVAMGLLLLTCGLSLSRTVPQLPEEIDKLLGNDTSSFSDSVSAAELKRNWPGFRGPDGNGFAAVSNLPSAWDVKTGAGIAWNIPSPAPGYNSPVVWQNRLYCSGVQDTERLVFCFNTGSGQVLWRSALPRGTSSRLPGTTSTASESSPNPLASSTIVTDGQRVYAFFGDGALAAFSLEGKLAWVKELGLLKNAYGHAASLVIAREKLFLQLDQGEADQGISRLYAFNSRRGEILWQTPRRVGSSWASPIIFEAGGRTQIVTLAVPAVIAYAVEDGRELWRVEGLNGEITPSPIFSAGLVFALSPSEKLFAVRPDGSGDVTKTHMAWSTEENVPDITSPASDGELLFTLTSSGILTCMTAANGKKQWDHDFEMEFHASPSIAAGRVYLFSTKGSAIVVEAARQFHQLFRAEMGDSFDASPAFADKCIFLRGATNIWCIGPEETKLAGKP
ncbi:MAG TPA: PQQ-binding-like beta-propeller repeat protein [Candidatus Dormibacteraeota bacterium]|nr:PQQ-binding-like beta-propeller repeat protein [Candidatus Dormibacteraeota bacterium]